MDINLTEQFAKARRVGTPIISISCFDPEATMQQIQKSIGVKKDSTPIIQTEVIRGWQGRNGLGTSAIDSAFSGTMADITETQSPVSALEYAQKLPARTILFVLNSHHHVSDKTWIQALWNLRDPFKENFRTVVLLSPGLLLPPELQQDVWMLDEPLPNENQLKGIVQTEISSADIAVSEDDLVKAVDALRGIPAFPAEQAVAMSLSKSNGLDINGLWDRKRQMIGDTPGLKVYEGKETFKDLGGCYSIKKFLQNQISGLEPPRVIVFIDEGEKMFAGATHEIGDNTGVSQDFLGTTLSYMEDHECDGSIFIGPPGAAKSAIAKALGNEAGVPTIMLDLGGMKASAVGESETRLRNAFKIITAVGGGRAYFIMTCNKIAELPPELKRRYTNGTFFFDLPNLEEREAIWKIYLDKYNLSNGNHESFDEDWTGAEIRNCCRIAYRQQLSIEDAAKYIIPVAKSDTKRIEALRRSAHGIYLSASYEGPYRYEDEKPKASAKTSKRNYEI